MGVKGLGGETSRGEKSRGEKAGVNRHVAIPVSHTKTGLSRFEKMSMAWFSRE